MELSGKVAVITGASSGIGEASARTLAGAGMHVVAAARRLDRLEALADEHPGVRPLRADVTNDDDVKALAAFVEEEFGACHALVNNAGVSGSSQFWGVDDVADVARVMDVNFMGTVRCTGAFADLLFASAPARVVNVASVAGKLGIGPPGYHASKFAAVGFSETLALQWARRGVTVTQLNPGFIRTEGFPQDHLRGTPLRRVVGEPQQVADALVDCLRRGPRERTVPRWYRPLVVLRHVAAPLFFAGAKRFR